jgi:hypothetical protein
MTPPAILLLAAGASSRMRGADKLLEPVEGVPLVLRQARVALATGASVIVTLPLDRPLRNAALAGLELTTAPVPDAALGLSASIRAGVRAAGASSVQPSRRPLPKPAPASSRTQLSPVGEAFLRELYLSELEARALHAASAAASTSAVQVVVDEDIKMLQLFLNEVMGRELVKPDGVYGPRTRQAVLDFQSRFGIDIIGCVLIQLSSVFLDVFQYLLAIIAFSDDQEEKKENEEKIKHVV